MNRKITVLFFAIGGLLGAGVSLLILKQLDPMNRQGEKNPWAYDMDALKGVDGYPITHKRTMTKELNFQPVAVAIDKKGKVVTGGDSYVFLNDEYVEVKGKVSSLGVSPDNDIFVGLGNRIVVIDQNQKITDFPLVFDDASILTAIVFTDSECFVADAGKKVVHRFDMNRKKLGELGKKDPDNGIPGLVIPSPYLDAAVSPDGELWVVNPGRHALENYDPEGYLKRFWMKTGGGIEGFCGCCNPAHIAFLPDGKIVTSEKGLSRIKIYTEMGDLSEIVATADDLGKMREPPDIAVSKDGTVYLTDFEQKQLIAFVRKEEKP